MNRFLISSSPSCFHLDRDYFDQINFPSKSRDNTKGKIWFNLRDISIDYAQSRWTLCTMVKGYCGSSFLGKNKAGLLLSSQVPLRSKQIT